MTESVHTLKRGEEKSVSRLSLGSWCLYDWANSAFNTVIITFIYSVYFARAVVGDETEGSAIWSYAIAISGFLIAILGPVLGAVADHYGARKGWLAFFSLLSIAATALLWFGAPDPSFYNIIFILTLVIIANIGFELSLIVYNAMLPHIAPPHMLGRISGWSWGLGYVGGLACLVLALFGLVGLGDTPPWFELPRGGSEHIRASAPFAALWFLAFSLPLLLFTHDAAHTGLTVRQALGRGLGQLKQTFRQIKNHANLARFLIASAIYRDGLNTLFAVGGLYAAGSFGMSFEEILIFAIGLNVSAGVGAVLFSFVDDRLGSKPTILAALTALIGIGLAVLLVQDKTVFTLLALALGIFIGPAQAASRTLAARLTPPEMVGQTYGLYAFTGKSVAFFGPLAFAAVTDMFDSQRAGMATIVLFWLAGMIVLLKVREK